jgi:hypothetical protein
MTKAKKTPEPETPETDLGELVTIVSATVLMTAAQVLTTIASEALKAHEAVTNKLTEMQTQATNTEKEES